MAIKKKTPKKPTRKPLSEEQRAKLFAQELELCQRCYERTPEEEAETQRLANIATGKKPD